MCNFPFFKDKITWGTSIRGAWWDIDATVPSKKYLPYVEDTLILYPTIDDEEWEKFINALIEFAEIELNTTKPKLTLVC